MKNYNKSLLSKIFIIIVFCLAFFLRFSQLSTIPNGLYQDETAIGYNAYSILQTQKDEHGKFLPLYFESFGDHKLPVYIYLTTASMKLWGVNEFAVRFPSALFGSLTIVVVYFLIRLTARNNTLALLASFFLAINPWHVHFSRAGFEVNVALFWAALGLFLLLKGQNSKKLLVYYLLSITAFMISAYTYNVSRIISPMLFLVLAVTYYKKQKRVTLRTITISLFYFFLLYSPFLLTLFTSSGFEATSDNLIIGGDVQAKLLEQRSYMLHLPLLAAKLLFNSWVQTLWTYMQNIVQFLSVDFFFITGSTHGNHGIGNVGTFYLFEFVLIIVGIYQGIKTKQGFLLPYYLWAIFTLLIVCLNKEVPHATRSFFIVLPVSIFSAYGMYTISDYLKSKHIFIKRTFLCFSIIICLYALIYFLSSYFFRFPIEYAKNWRSEDKSLIAFLQNEESNFDKIIVDTNSDMIYTSLLFYSQYSPQKFHNEQVREETNRIGFSKVISFNKYVFSDMNNIKNEESMKTLYVTSNPENAVGKKVIKEFYYPPRQIVLSHDGVLLQYPSSDIAYIVYQ